MEVITSPHKTAVDSPSKQLLYELSLLEITAQEDFYACLDKENQETEALHNDALAAAAREHERVRRAAEFEQEKLELRLQAERKRKEEEDRKVLEKKRKEKADQEIAEKRKEIERAKQAELEERRLAEAHKAEAIAAEKKRVEQERKNAEIARRLKETQDAEARAEASAKEAVIAAQKTTSASQTSRNPAREAEHQRFVAVHRNCKELRRFMMTEAQKSPPFKLQIGDMRREIKKCVGQLTEGKGANKVPLQQIISVLRESLQVQAPKVEVTLFLANPPNPLPSSDSNLPSVLLYLLNIFAKAVVAQFIDEAGVSPRTADPIGIIGSHIFSLKDFQWQGISLIDILIAKMHVVCPVLFGIYGDESTIEGKLRLSWGREDKDGPYISEQRHNERMTGLGAGFASLALRNYEKSKLDNPYPNINYWRSLACITNVPSAEVTTTHCIVLKAMIENYEQRFLEFFGDAGLAALKVSLVEFPKRAARQNIAAKALAGLADILRRDKKLKL